MWTRRRSGPDPVARNPRRQFLPKWMSRFVSDRVSSACHTPKVDTSGPCPLSVVLGSCQPLMVWDVPTGGTAIAPTMRETFAADAGEQLTCSRVGCDQPATLFWYEECTGEQLAYCPEDGVEAFAIIKRWTREPEARMSIERHAIAVEKAANRGLYDQPMRWRGGYDGDDRKTKP